MKIAFFTELQFLGKISRDHKNRRTEFCWMIALDAFHIPLGFQKMNEISGSFDLGIVIVPKNIRDHTIYENFMRTIRSICKKVTIMQEGPNWYFQDYSIEQQIWYYNTLVGADFLLCHNESDIPYYEGLTGKRVYNMPSLMTVDNLKKSDKKYQQAIIGGNFVSWYGSFDSYIVAQEFNVPIYAPHMGRMPAEEIQFEELKHLPYLDWTDWIETLSEFRYGVHLMRIQAAGTFAMNCAYLGIPCIGYKGLDTQEILHPKLAVAVGDLKTAKELARKLRDDETFYHQCASASEILWLTKYSEDKFKEKMNKVFEKEYND